MTKSLIRQTKKPVRADLTDAEFVGLFTHWSGINTEFDNLLELTGRKHASLCLRVWPSYRFITYLHGIVG